MNKQNLRFISEVVGALPELNPHQREFWLARPNKMEEFLSALKNFDLQFVDKKSIAHRLFTEDFNLLEFLKQPNLIAFDSNITSAVTQIANKSFGFTGSYVSYSHTKIPATEIEIRSDLPEQHLFNDCGADDLSVSIALLRQSVKYGFSGGLSFNTLNVFFIKTQSAVAVIEIQQVNQAWKVNMTPNNPHKTYEANTRVFFPSSQK